MSDKKVQPQSNASVTHASENMLCLVRYRQGVKSINLHKAKQFLQKPLSVEHLDELGKMDSDALEKAVCLAIRLLTPLSYMYQKQVQQTREAGMIPNIRQPVGVMISLGELERCDLFVQKLTQFILDHTQESEQTETKGADIQEEEPSILSSGGC